MKFSIIIPSYNQAEYIEQCLDSIVNQEYNNFEILIIDAQSKDGTLKIIKQYSKEYPNLIKYISEKDSGQADAINKGIKISRGELITWQNCDDKYLNNNVLRDVSNIFSSDNSLKLVYGNMDLIDQNSGKIRTLKYSKVYFDSLLYEGMVLSNQCTFWKKNLHKEIGLLKNTRTDFDYEWFLRVFKVHANNTKHINKSLGAFRLHRNQKTFFKSKSDIENLNNIKISYDFNKKIKYFKLVKLKLLKLIYYIKKREFVYILKKLFRL